MAKAYTCPCCGGSEHQMRESKGLCRMCFMLWYDSGITSRERLRKESLWRAEHGYWPWTKVSPPYAELKAAGFVD